MKQNIGLKRVVSSLLAVLCVTGYAPLPTAAAQNADTCEHHPEHTAWCGYVEAADEITCSHIHDEESCYVTTTVCLHTEHSEECGYTEGTPGVPCSHVCSVESGCITTVLNCYHNDDGSCCYIAAQEGSPCGYKCDICTENTESDDIGSGSQITENGSDKKTQLLPECTCTTTCTEDAVNSECFVCAAAYAECAFSEIPEFDEAVENVRAMLDMLPTVDDIETMESTEQENVKIRLDETLAAYNALTDEQKNQLTDAETVLTELSAYFENRTGIVSYDIYVGGVQITEENAADVLENETVWYDAGTATLTMTDAYISGFYAADNGYDYAIYTTGDLTIVASGINTVDYEIYTEGELQLEGDGLFITPSETTVLSDYVLTEDLVIGNSWNFVNGSKLERGDFNVAVTENGTVLTDGIEHLHNEDGEPIYEQSADDITSHVKIISCAECPIGYTSEQEEAHTAADESGVCVCGVSLVAPAAENGIILGETLSKSLSSGNTLSVPFTPEYTHLYNFSGKAARSANIYICDSEENVVASRTNTTSFSIICTLEEGETYYFSIGYAHSSYNGTVEILLDTDFHEYVENDSGEYVCICGDIADNLAPLGETFDIEVAAGQTVKIPFVPEITHAYSFTGSGSSVTGYFYDSTGTALTAQNRYSSTFNASYVLEAGETYYLAVRYYNASTVGTVSALFEMMTDYHNYEVNEDGIYACGCGDTAETMMPLDESVALNLGSNERVSIPFIPEMTHSYELMGSGSSSASAIYIYDAAGKALDTSSSAYSFSVAYKLTAGETYYMVAYSYVKEIMLKLGDCHDYKDDGNGVFTCICGAQAPTVTLGEKLNVSVDTDMVTKIPYVPEITHSYILIGLTTENTVGYFYDASDTMLTNRVGAPFSVTYSLTEGETYYLGIAHNNSKYSDIPAMLQLGPHDYELQDNGEYACSCGEKTTAIKLQETRELEVGSDNIVTIPFTADLTHTYVFKSTSADSEAYVYIFDETGKKLASNYGNPFSVNYAFEQGKTYYLSVGSAEVQNVSVTVDYTNHNFTKQDDGKYTCICGAESYTITRGETLYVNVAAGETVKIPFVPDINHSYGFDVSASEAGGSAVYGCIYDSNGTSLSYNSGSTADFSLIRDLTAGQTYYLGVRFNDAGVAETIPVKIDYVNHNYVDSGDGIYACTCGERASMFTVGKWLDLDVDLNETVKLPFTPHANHMYVLTTPNGVGAGGYFYDESGNQLNYTSGTGYLSLTYTLTADTPYYISIRHYYNSTSGNIPVMIDYTNHSFAETEDGEHVCECGVGWKVENGTLTIFGEGGTGNYSGYSSVPWYSLRNTITSVVIEDGITSIGNYALYGLSNVTSFEIPDSVVSIGNYAFYNCSGIADIDIPDGVKNIGSYAFSNCKALTSVDIPKGVVAITSSVFKGCSNLTKVVIPDGVESIGNSAFYDCSSLTDINIPDSVTSIESSAFYNCKSITSIDIPEGVTAISSYAFYGCSTLENVIIPDDVTSIGSYAFYGCTALTDVTIPNSVTAINSYAFYNCRSLTGIDISDNVKTIGDYAFYGCKGLTSVVVPVTVTSFGNHVFAYCTGLTEATIEDGVTSIKDYTFSGCNNLVTVHIPDSVTSIGNYAFYECSSLPNIGLPDTVTSIGNNAFYRCDSLTDVVIPDSVAYIGEYAFYDSENLTSVILPQGLTTINVSTFHNCQNLKSVVIPDSVTTISRDAFCQCYALESITIPSGVTSIQNEVFYNCSALKEIVWNAKDCSDIASSILSGTNSLQSVVIDTDVDVLSENFWNYIGCKATELVFKGPNYFTTVDIPSDNSIEYPLGDLKAGYYYVDQDGLIFRIENEEASLVYCPSGIENLTVPTEIPAEDGLTSYSVTAVGSHALYDADTLMSVTFTSPENIKELSALAMADCPTLESVNGQTTAAGAKATFTNARIGVNVFMNTGLEDTDEGIEVSDNIIISKGDSDTTEGLQLIIETASGEYYTGETCKTTISVSNPDNVASDNILRVYFQFSDTDGAIGLSVGTHEFKVGENTYILNVCETESDLIYYVEFPQPKEGGSISLDLTTSYPSPSSDGGSVKIWGAILTPEEAAALGNGTAPLGNYHKSTWITKKDVFPVKKTNYTTAPSLIGDGGEEGNVYVQDLRYTISMTREGDTLEGIGKDYITSVDYEDVLTLPEGTSWRDGVVDAIEKNNYRIAQYSNTTYYYVTIDGTEYQLCYVSGSSSSNYTFTNSRISLKDGKVVLDWTVKNKSAIQEIPNPSLSLVYMNNVICITDEGLAAGKVYTFKNDLAAVQHFTHSGDVEYTSFAETNVTAGAASFDLNKSTYGSTTSNLGSKYNFRIQLYNKTALPYKNLEYVTDTLPNLFYIKPEDMQTMFGTDADDPDAELIITITRATICSKIPRAEDTVTGTDGEEYHIVNATTGVNTEYSGTEFKDSVDTYYETIELKWAEDKNSLVLTIAPEITAEDGTVTLGEANNYTIGEGEGYDYPDIAAAFASLGYLVTNQTEFRMTWMLKEDYILYGGQTENFYALSTLKDSFMYTDIDVENFVYPQSQSKNYTNRAYAYYTAEDGSLKNKSAGISSNIYSDFELYKTASVDNKAVDLSTKLEEGKVINYTLDLTHYGTAAYDALPFVDHLQGGQVLMVPESGNAHLGEEPYNLTHDNIGGTLYYVLDTPGTYEGVTLGGLLTDSIVVTDSDGSTDDGTLSGLNTLIRWYLTDINGSVTKTVNYKALVSPTRAGSEGVVYYLNNEVWVGDHQSHRIWDAVGLDATRVAFEKKIVTELGEAEVAEDDKLEDYCPLIEGKTVTYRFMFRFVSTYEDVVGTLTGKDLYDVLPASVNDFWDASDITVRYVASNKANLEVKNGDNWYVTAANPADVNNPDRQYLRWGEDFSMTFDGTVYVYVTLKCPDGEEWIAYADKYSNTRLQNDLYVYDLKDSVYHDLSIIGEAVLQKGVYYTAVRHSSKTYTRGYSYNTSTNSRWYYANDDAFNRMVFYYVTLYNGGVNRLYINDMQDILPKGFTFYGMYFSNSDIDRSYGGGGYSSYQSVHSAATLASVADTDLSGSVSWRYANVSAATEMLESNQKITFTITDYTGSNSNDLLYDEIVGKYYLDPGQGVKFAYAVRTNKTSDTEDIALNSVVMPYYNQTGAGVTLSENVTITGEKIGSAEVNDGGCDILENNEAESLGYSGGQEDTQWLYSSVELKRGNIVPGITKSVKSVTKPANGTVVNDPLYAEIQDIINWKVDVTNEGEYPITDYTLTDVMQKPYQFTGEVKYNVYYNTNNAYYRAEGTVFTIESRSDDSITIKTTENKTRTLTIGGEPLEISFRISAYISATSQESKSVNVYVSFCLDENGNEVLALHFTDGTMSIPEGGRAELYVSTVNNGAYESKMFYNTSYITPDVQEYDQTQVTQGNNTVLDTSAGEDKPTVRNSCPITVTMGYVTSSVKMVEETDKPTNNAASNSAVNYIVLPNKKSEFKYTLQVDNTTENAMEKLILIDNLPEVNDHSTFVKEDPRYSEFKVSLSTNPDFGVTVIQKDKNGSIIGEPKILSSDKYTVQYSDKTEFNNVDWSGGKSPDWYDTPKDTTRSFRVVIIDNKAETDVLIPSYSTVSVNFPAVIDGEAEPGQIAWNSFGYHYKLVGTPTELEAAPLKVGIKIPSAPEIQKKLTREDGTAYSVENEDGEIFRFLIYRGEAIELADNYTEAELAQSLLDEEREFTYVVLKVEQGKSESEVLMLKDAVVYTYADDTWLPLTVADEDGSTEMTEVAWTWVDGETYTVTELPLDEEQNEFVQYTINGNTDSYTFTHNESKKIMISAINQRKLWNAALLKVDSTTNGELPGAVFGLYSPNAGDLISDEDYAELVTELGISPLKTITVSNAVEESTGDNAAEQNDAVPEDGMDNADNENSTKYYLMQVKTSGSTGQIRWEDLFYQEYYVRELKAPTGYNLKEEPIRLRSENYEDLPAITVSNAMGYVLPETGGTGTQLFTFGGVFAITGSLLGYEITKRKRRKDEGKA